jgi:hypothetical protein
MGGNINNAEFQDVKKIYYKYNKTMFKELFLFLLTANDEKLDIYDKAMWEAILHHIAQCRKDKNIKIISLEDFSAMVDICKFKSSLKEELIKDYNNALQGRRAQRENNKN